jgi:Domain of unknown function (DUF6378)
MKASDIASKGAELVGGERAHVHGDKIVNHDKIAAVWNGILHAAGKPPMVPLDGHDVTCLMEGLKIARRFLGRFNPEDYIDAAGYAACAGEIAAAAQARTDLPTIELFHGVDAVPSYKEMRGVFKKSRPK